MKISVLLLLCLTFGITALYAKPEIPCSDDYDCREIGDTYELGNYSIKVVPGAIEWDYKGEDYISNPKVELTLDEDFKYKYTTDSAGYYGNVLVLGGSGDSLTDRFMKEIIFKKGSELIVRQDDTIEGSLKENTVLSYSIDGGLRKYKITARTENAGGYPATVSFYSNARIKDIGAIGEDAIIPLRNGQLLIVEGDISFHRNGHYRIGWIQNEPMFIVGKYLYKLSKGNFVEIDEDGNIDTEKYGVTKIGKIKFDK